MKCIGWVENDEYARRSYETIYDTGGLWTAKDIRKIGGVTSHTQTFGPSGFHAKMSASQEGNEEWKSERVRDYFSTLCGYLTKKKINPSGCSLKMLKICSLLTEEMPFLEFSMKWQAEGTVLSGKCITRKITEYRKAESECTLLDIMETQVGEKLTSLNHRIETLRWVSDEILLILENYWEQLGRI